MSTTDKKEKVENLRRYHQNLLESIGVSDALYIPRMAYKPSSHHEIVISFFASELKQGKDIFTEFVSKEFEPEDPDRTLWKWRYNPFWKEEYERSNPRNTGKQRQIDEERSYKNDKYGTRDYKERSENNRGKNDD